eukprot:jgi/Chlat1/960/Chrsp108S01385
MRPATRPSSSSSVRMRRLALVAALLGGIALLAVVGATLLGAGPYRWVAAAAAQGQLPSYHDLQIYQQQASIKEIDLTHALSVASFVSIPYLPQSRFQFLQLCYQLQTDRLQGVSCILGTPFAALLDDRTLPVKRHRVMLS